MPTVAVVYFSATGHTQTLAEAVAAGAGSVAGTTAEVCRIVGEDITAGRWKNDAIAAKLTAADAIVFGTPTYMGGYAGQFKAFVDGCSGIWYQQGWKDKIAAGFTHSQGLSGDKLNTLTGLFINAMQHSMVWVGPAVMVQGPDASLPNRLASYSGAMAQTFPGDAPVPAGDVETARLLGVRVAEAAARWGK